MVTRLIHFVGKVQGVGFRYTVDQIAQQLPVVGYVKNLENGEVELAVQGGEEDIARLLDGIKVKMARNILTIRQQTLHDLEAKEFRIRY